MPDDPNGDPENPKPSKSVRRRKFWRVRDHRSFGGPSWQHPIANRHGHTVVARSDLAEHKTRNQPQGEPRRAGRGSPTRPNHQRKSRPGRPRLLVPGAPACRDSRRPWRWPGRSGGLYSCCSAPCLDLPRPRFPIGLARGPPVCGLECGGTRPRQLVACLFQGAARDFLRGAIVGGCRCGARGVNRRIGRAVWPRCGGRPRGFGTFAGGTGYLRFREHGGRIPVRIKQLLVADHLRLEDI